MQMTVESVLEVGDTVKFKTGSIRCGALPILDSWGNIASSAPPPRATPLYRFQKTTVRVTTVQLFDLIYVTEDNRSVCLLKMRKGGWVMTDFHTTVIKSDNSQREIHTAVPKTSERMAHT